MKEGGTPAEKEEQGLPALAPPPPAAGGVSQLGVLNRQQLDASRSSLLPFLPGAPKREFPPSKIPDPATVTFLCDFSWGHAGPQSPFLRLGGGATRAGRARSSAKHPDQARALEAMGTPDSRLWTERPRSKCGRCPPGQGGLTQASPPGVRAWLTTTASQGSRGAV